MPTGVPSWGSYFARPAERLVLDGYRSLQSARNSQRQDDFDAASKFFHSLLPARMAKSALQALVVFVSQLAACNGCPLKSFPAETHHVTRYEVLLLGLIAGVQNGDDQCVRTCLNQITCASRCEEVAFAAANFALTLRCFGQQLGPVPLEAIEDVLVRSRSVTIH